MFLKRIDLYGFKSFADRTELEFVPGISAVVGPNGSGKSNIADAIRWVLGEQSAKSLRGVKMEDVIFAGSDTRKGVNFAEVSLTLDNSDRTLPLDYSEVTVTRRLYRTGESEFLINKSSCRLKDIVELFMDTGLGREAYSIIGQGRIEEILSTKAEERRGVFEEAAGIVKYKVRKKESEKKLEETEKVLLRVTDILGEIETQLTPLKEQAAVARRYREMKEALKEKEIGLYLHSIGNTYARWEESKKKVEALSEQDRIASAKMSQWDAEVEAKRWQLTQLEQELDRVNERLVGIVEQVERLDGERKLNEERIKHTSDRKDGLSEEWERLQKKKEGLFQKKAEILQEKERLMGEKEELEEALRELEERMKALEHSSEEALERLKNEYIETLSQLAAARNEEKNLTQQTEQNAHKRERAGAEIAAMVEEKRHLEEKWALLRKKEEETSTHLASLKDEIAKQSEKMSEQKGKQEAAHQRLRRIEQEEQQLSSRLSTLKEMQADFAGFHQGAREILLMRNKGLKGIVGAVLELIQVPKALDTAIEITLGPALQHIVTEDEPSAREAIAYLKKNQSGRATFLPLSVMKGRRLSAEEEAKLQHDDGVVGIASDLVHFEERYRQVVENLLGNVVIVKDLVKANEIARRLHYRYRIVTLDGEMVNPGGSMTGGSLKQKGNSLLGRERVLEETERQLERVQKEMQALRHEMAAMHEEEEKERTALLELRKKLEEKSSALTEYKTEITKLQAELKNAESTLLYRQTEMDQWTAQEGEVAERYRQLKERFSTLTQAEASLKQRIEEMGRAKLDQESSKKEITQEMTRLKVLLAGKEQEWVAVRENMTRIDREIAEAEAEAGEKEKELAALTHGEEDLLAEKRRLGSDGERLRRTKEELQTLLDERKRERKALTDHLEEMEKEGKSLRKRVKEIQGALHQEEVKENRAEIELDNDLEKLREDYDLTYEAAKEFYTPPPEEEIYLIRMDVLRLKQEMSSLGEVNLGAIEEFERLSERKRFYATQSEDLNKAKETLYQVIREIEEEMKKRFEDTFSLIQIQFRRAFAELFGGGRADLVLTDPENPLETGVEIMAQPPGKKLQNLSLLSGGERSLTAIALLFAILRVRPVPFCLLDEVDAALDASNVARFARYLKDFSDETQFIVITHRKGTMEEANVLYGVTMEGSGVSKIISVRLEEVREEGEGKLSISS